MRVTAQRNSLMYREQLVGMLVEVQLYLFFRNPATWSKAALEPVRIATIQVHRGEQRRLADEPKQNPERNEKKRGNRFAMNRFPLRFTTTALEQLYLLCVELTVGVLFCNFSAASSSLAGTEMPKT